MAVVVVVSILNASTHPSIHQPHKPTPTPQQIDAPDVGQTDRAWLLRAHKKWQPAPALRLSIPGRAPPDAKAEAKAEAAARRALAAGVAMPSRLVPVFMAFFLDAVGTGLASPILPFYIMGLGANAFQLGLVLAFNYAAQVIRVGFWGVEKRCMWIDPFHPCLPCFFLVRTTNYS